MTSDLDQITTECRLNVLIGFSVEALTAFLDGFQGRIERSLQNIVIDGSSSFRAIVRRHALHFVIRFTLVARLIAKDDGKAPEAATRSRSPLRYSQARP